MKLTNTLNIFNKNKRYVAAPSTFSRSLDDAAYTKIPFAIKKGTGSYVYDYDNNKYIDTIMSLGAVVIGHSNKKINSEVIKQIKKGATLKFNPEVISPEELIKVTYYLEAVQEPHIGPWRVYQDMRKNGFNVSLEGHGGDELLGGYPEYVDAALEDNLLPVFNNNKFTFFDKCSYTALWKFKSHRIRHI